MTNTNQTRTDSSNIMTRHNWLIALLSVAALAGCTSAGPEINRVQTNLVDKGIFEGEWWVLQTVVEADGDATALGHAYIFPGGSSWDLSGGIQEFTERDGGLNYGRIRWVIDENYLYAYRSYEIIDGGNNDGRDGNFRGQPLAAFPIEGHIDIRRSYSSLTGERTNVIVENTTDRRWYEREYMRVDWSSNDIASFTFLSQLSQTWWQPESAPFFIQEDGSHPDFPHSYAPQFVRVGEDPDYRFRDEWPEGTEDTIHYMSFTTMTLFSPGADCLTIGIPQGRSSSPGWTGACQSVAVPVRTAFLRVPPEHEYAAETQSHTEFDRFGLFRTWQRTYVRGGNPGDASRTNCDEDQDCGAGGYCDMDRGICSGGLSSDYGETDFLTFYRPRHNIFRDVYRRDGDGNFVECLADWECNDRLDGTPNGSQCDRATRRCTIPVHERERRQVVYHLNDGHPAYLTKAAYEVIGNWNEAFMRGWRASHGETVPNYSVARVDSQDDDPTAYCFSNGSVQHPEVEGDGTCMAEYNPFISPSEWEDMGVENPYDCFVQNADGWEDPARPESFDEYELPSAQRWEFVGEECQFILKTNTCDWYRDDSSVHCDDVVDDDGNPVRWQQQGDIRYQFYNYVRQVATKWGGVSELRTDPTTGELVTADANYSAGSVEARAWIANVYLPALRCAGDNGCAPGEEGADIELFQGDTFRSYAAGLGTVERPIRLAPVGNDGVTIEDYSRPAMPAERMNDAYLSRIYEALPRIEPLMGEEARFHVLTDRVQGLAGTPEEEEFLAGLGDELSALYHTRRDGVTDMPLDASALEMADQLSPIRDQSGSGLISSMMERDRERIALAKAGVDNFDADDFMRNRYYEFWAEAFRGRSGAEAAIRLQQNYARGVQHHEIGHSVGLRHNLGGSFDRNNYGLGYHQLVVRDGLELPQLDDFDEAANGGDEDGFVGGAELNRYSEELRRLRNERAARGAHNHMTASIMDYNGDMSDVSGLGAYDIAATVWNYYDLVETYVGDPRVSSGGSSDDLRAQVQQVDGNWTATQKEYWRSYSGGDSCDIDDDCPHSFGAPTLTPEQAVFQRCIRNPRNSRLPEPCDGDANCVCSNFSTDMLDYEDGFAYNNDEDDDRVLDHLPVEYLFCGDERTNDISWCTYFDAGESFQESVDHFRRRFYESYTSYYRRFTGGTSMGASSTGINAAAKIYQHVFFRLFFEPGFLSNEGALGFRDQFAASADAMNWMFELVNLPEQGSYAENRANNSYRFLGEDQDMTGADFSLAAGEGFGTWSKYQDGHQGFFRFERAGVLYDKIYALWALSVRDWQLTFTLDERYFINFYDLFALEMTEFFGGMILDEETWFAPRVDMSGSEPSIIHPQYNQGLIFGECNQAGRTVPCNGNISTLYPEPVLEGTSNIWLRRFAAIRALQTFPVFYDTSFEQRLVVWRLGEGTGANIPDTRADGTPACVYGEYAVDGTHEMVDPAGPERCNSPDDATYGVYYSDRLHTSYAAVKVEPRLNYNTAEEQLGFRYLQKLIELQAEVRRLEATPGSNPETLSRLRRELVENESFLNQLIRYMQAFGISSAGWF